METILGIGASLLRIGRNEKALEAFKEVLKINPENIPAKKSFNCLKARKAN